MAIPHVEYGQPKTACPQISLLNGQSHSIEVEPLLEMTPIASLHQLKVETAFHMSRLSILARSQVLP